MENEQKNGSKKANYFLNFLKGIACLLVVFMHAEFPGYLGVVVQTVSRFCVPLFFMISGYYSFYNDESNRIGFRKALHILRIIAFASVLYLVIYLINSIISNNWGIYNFSTFVEFFAFNEPHIISNHLWFLFALFYVYLLYWFVEKFKLQKLLHYLIPILFCSYVFLAQGLWLMGYSLQNFYYRNFFIEGLLFFSIGHFIHFHQDKIKFNNILLIVVFVLSTILCVVERKFVGRDFGVNISTFPQVISLFIVAIQNSGMFKNNFITKMGKNYSLFIYILHPAVSLVLIKMYSIIGVDKNTVASYLLPIFVVLFTLLISILIALFLKLIKFVFFKKTTTNNDETHNITN